MDINRENMDIFFQDLKTGWTDAFQAANAASMYKQVAFEIKSNSDSMVHAWLNQLPQMRPWIGDRQVNNIQSKSLTVVNGIHENTIEMPRVDIEDDKHGLYKPIVGAMGADAAAYPDVLCAEALLKGTSDKWVDDVAFFSASGRTYGDNTIANYTTSALSTTSFNVAYAAMTSYVGHNNRPIRVTPKYLVHGPALRTKAFEVLEDDFAARTADAVSSTYPNQGRNPNKGTVVPIQSDMLIDGLVIDGTEYDAANYWFLMGECAGIMGLVYQNRLPAELQMQKWSVDSEFTFDTDKFQVGTRLRGAAFLAIPHLIHGNFAA